MRPRIQGLWAKNDAYLIAGLITPYTLVVFLSKSLLIVSGLLIIGDRFSSHRRGTQENLTTITPPSTGDDGSPTIFGKLSQDMVFPKHGSERHPWYQFKRYVRS
jgi:hypothetical protein